MFVLFRCHSRLSIYALAIGADAWYDVVCSVPSSQGVSIRTQAEEALSLLVAQYEALCPTSITPQPSNPDELTNTVAAIALSGDFAQWGSVHGVFHALHGFMRYLGVDHLADLKHKTRSEIEQAIWVCLRAVPERRVSECVRIIRRVISDYDYLHGDWSTLATLDDEKARRIVRSVINEPTAALILMQAVGSDARPLPSGGASVCLMRMGVISAWEPDYFTHGFPAVREEARRILTGLQPEAMLAVEWWGTWGCDGDDDGIGSRCSGCAANQYCRSICEGLV